MAQRPYLGNWIGTKPPEGRVRLITGVRSVSLAAPRPMTLYASALLLRGNSVRGYGPDSRWLAFERPLDCGCLDYAAPPGDQAGSGRVIMDWADGTTLMLEAVDPGRGFDIADLSAGEAEKELRVRVAMRWPHPTIPVVTEAQTADVLAELLGPDAGSRM